MKIILVATGAKGKNVVFVADTLKTYPLTEAVRLAKAGKFEENVYAVQKSSGAHLRSSRSVPKREQLEQLAISSRQLFNSANDIRHAVSTPALARYLQLYEHALQKNGGPFIIIEGKVKITKEAAKQKLQPHQKTIFDAAQQFNIDPYLLGAIIIDEIAQFAPWEPITDPLFGYAFSINASAGVAQVRLETARGLIKARYYNPDPANPHLAPEEVGKVPRRDLYEYVKKPKHSILFAAARMRELTDRWKRFVDLSTRPNIVATLYHLSDKKKAPHGNPQPNDRGLQIAGEFYSLAQEWLQ